jgi:hypothetical protein
MTKLNTKTDAQVTWEKEVAIATKIMGTADKDELHLINHEGFLKYVELKRSFHDQAEDMVRWITKEQSKDHGLVQPFAYFMDKGYTINKPDRYEYRSAVFNDLADAIRNGSEYNIYDIVRSWDMFFHS